MGIQVLERAFALLHLLADQPSEVRLGELAEGADLPKSTASRILATLADLGAAERGERGGTWRLGSRTFAGPDRSEQVLIRVARPHLRRLVDELDEDTGLALPDGDRLRYVDQVRSLRPVQIRGYLDEPVPAHTTAAGLVLLADLADEDLRGLLRAPLLPFGRGTPVDPADLLRTVEEVRREGLAWTWETWADGINGAAAAVRGADGALDAAVNVFGPSYRFPGDRDRDAVGRLLLEVCGSIGRDLDRARGAG